MSDHFVHKVHELAQNERVLIERWLGRSLSNDETISVSAYRPYASPPVKSLIASAPRFCCKLAKLVRAPAM